MANKDPSRTEKPTGKKISDARKDGKVVSSPDVSSFVILIAGLLMLFITVPMLRDAFIYTLRLISDTDCRMTWDNQIIHKGALTAILTIAKITAPFMLAMALFAILVMRCQVGKFFHLKPLKWKFSGLNPKSGLMQLLPNKQNIIKLLLTMAKVFSIGYFVYLSIRSDMENFPMLIYMPLAQSGEWLAKRCLAIMLKVLVFFVVIAIIDYIVKKKKYIDDLMMTKQEVKDERKNSEGDPLIKSKIRQKMRALIRAGMMKSVINADVIITNPTHVAVALKYEYGAYAPKVVAKGLRKTALRIKMLGKLAGVPTIEAPPLARSLYRNTDVGHYIPPEFYGAVAAILAKLHKSGRKVFT
jgi:flagellar biosynthetic protein FlhB